MVHPRLPRPTHNSYQAREQNFPTKACKPPAAPWWALGLSERRPGTLRPRVVPFVLRPALILLLPHSLNTAASVICRTIRPRSHAISSTVIFSLVLRATLLTYHLNNCWKEITFRESPRVNEPQLSLVTKPHPLSSFRQNLRRVHNQKSWKLLRSTSTKSFISH